jgi:HSP20 family protein
MRARSQGFLQEPLETVCGIEAAMVDEAETWIPPMDIYEVDGNYIVNAELPGVEARSIKMKFSNSEFAITGERRFESAWEKESYDMLEMHRGRFQRKFSLPEPVDKKRIRWQLKGGVLHVVIPKSG